LLNRVKTRMCMCKRLSVTTNIRCQGKSFTHRTSPSRVGRCCRTTLVRDPTARGYPLPAGEESAIECGRCSAAARARPPANSPRGAAPWCCSVTVVLICSARFGPEEHTRRACDAMVIRTYHPRTGMPYLASSAYYRPRLWEFPCQHQELWIRY
jgi:hypothetical protein